MASLPYCFQPIRVPGSPGVPDIRWLRYATAQSYLNGAVVKYDGAGSVVEASANPVNIVGVALQNAVSGSGTNMGDAPDPITGFEQKNSIGIANRQTVWGGALVNGDEVLIAPTQADVGLNYGITKLSTGIWVVDKSKTLSDARVQIVGFSAFVHSPGIVEFKFLESAMTPNP